VSATAATATEWLDLRRVGSRVHARGRVPEDLPQLQGHFPGRPVLPGIVQLQWALDVAREQLGVTGAPSALEALKFRRPLLPAEEFELRVDAARGLRFEIDAPGENVSSGRARFDAEPPQHAPEPLALARSDRSDRSDDWPLRLPHAGPMRWIERVVAHDAGATLCEGRFGDAAPRRGDGYAPAWLALELLAQGMACQGGLAAGDAATLRGLLVGARRIELRTRGFAPDEALWVHVRHLRGEVGFVLCECALGTGKPPASDADARDLALARGTLTAFVESARD
jgi:predicted hotdog family 3-hydroxylacyl-ACP dehydratase